MKCFENNKVVCLYVYVCVLQNTFVLVKIFILNDYISNKRDISAPEYILCFNVLYNLYKVSKFYT